MTRFFAAFLMLFLSSASYAGMTISPAAPRRGEIVLLTFRDVEISPASRMDFEGVLYPVWKDEDGAWKGFIVADRDLGPGPHRVTLHTEGAKDREIVSEDLQIADRKFQEQHLKVDEKMVSLSKKDLDRVERERKIIGAALATLTEERFWKSAFAVPVVAEVSSPFGLLRFYNGKPGSYHAGIDLAAARGTEVHAISEGRVVLTGNFFYTGNTVFVDHGLGLISGYFHMDAVKVVQGQQVGQGAVLGLVGSTGRSTGPHLHWSVYLCARKADPESLVNVTAKGMGGGKILDSQARAF